MAYTAPKTWATDEVLTSSDLNTYVGANITWLATGKGAVAAYNSTTFSHSSSGNWRNPTFDSESYDTGASTLHSTVTNTDRVTIVETGLYLVTAAGRWDSNVTGNRVIGLDLNATNGGGLLEGYSTVTASALGPRHTLTFVARFTAADILRTAYYQDSGGTRTVTPRMTVTWLGA